MLLGTPRIIECPSCGMHQQRHTLKSGNTFGAKYYSDGKCVAPMFVISPTYVKCPSCGIFFKISSQAVVGYASPIKACGKKEDGLIVYEDTNGPFVNFLSIEEHCQAIKKGIFNNHATNSDECKNDILSLRISLWRMFNDKMQQGCCFNMKNRRSSKRNRNKDVYYENCCEIISIIHKIRDDTSYLMQAEIHRNLGEFDKCKMLLDEIKEYNKYAASILAIKEACDNKNCLTVCINPDSCSGYGKSIFPRKQFWNEACRW